MDQPIDQVIHEIILELKKTTGTRETSIAITKLEEALMWWKRHEELRKEQLKASGVGMRDVMT